jgi:hypothetical protein
MERDILYGQPLLKVIHLVCSREKIRRISQLFSVYYSILYCSNMCRAPSSHATVPSIHSLAAPEMKTKNIKHKIVEYRNCFYG